MSDKLQKLLAHAGLASRREIERWISDGRITVNGKRANIGDRAAAQDRILVDGKVIYLQSRGDQAVKALLYHKPEGEICSRDDPQGRPTIFENLPALPTGRWVSVGRLDINTSGLLLLTDSGDLANKLMHPSTGLEREYLVRVRGKASEAQIELLTKTGVDIDGKKARFESVTGADLAQEGTNHWYRVVIKEGRYREVRRMWDALGYTVSRLKRIRYGTVKLTRDLKRGQVARMAPMQLERLVSSAGLQDQFANQLYSASRGGTPTANKSTASSSTTSERQPADRKRSATPARGTRATKGDRFEKVDDRSRPTRRSAKTGATKTPRRNSSTKAPTSNKPVSRKR